MRTINFDSALLLGLSDIDEEHQVLICQANEVLQAIRAGQRASEIAITLGTLADSAEVHFRSEEVLMLACRFAQYEPHRLDHRHLLAEIHLVREKVASGQIRHYEVLDFYIRSWVTHHAATFDMELAAALKPQPPQENSGSSSPFGGPGSLTGF